MTYGLFSDESGPIQLPVKDAELIYWESIDLQSDPTQLLDLLIHETPWRAEEIVMWGKRHLQPRLIAWYGDKGASYAYSGIALDPLPWTAPLLKLKRQVEAIAGCQFNSVLLNYYRDHRDSMGMHSDDEPELGPQPIIASLSLGAIRTLVFTHKSDKDQTGFKLPLKSGSLLIMKGLTQKKWKHGINKSTQPCGPRVNLTFRRIACSGLSGAASQETHPK
jgi:alkylated DNA repair dioxygenase AlkB